MNIEEKHTTTRIIPADIYYSKFEYVNQKLRHVQLVNNDDRMDGGGRKFHIFQSRLQKLLKSYPF